MNHKDSLGLQHQVQEQIMANRYINAQFDLTTTDATDVYTAPSESRAIIQNRS